MKDQEFQTFAQVKINDTAQLPQTVNYDIVDDMSQLPKRSVEQFVHPQYTIPIASFGIDSAPSKVAKVYAVVLESQTLNIKSVVDTLWNKLSEDKTITVVDLNFNMNAFYDFELDKCAKNFISLADVNEVDVHSLVLKDNLARTGHYKVLTRNVKPANCRLDKICEMVKSLASTENILVINLPPLLLAFPELLQHFDEIAFVFSTDENSVKNIQAHSALLKKNYQQALSTGGEKIITHYVLLSAHDAGKFRRKFSSSQKKRVGVKQIRRHLGEEMKNIYDCIQ